MYISRFCSLENEKTDEMTPPSFRTATLGCKVNACDTNALAEALVAGGFARAEKGVAADVVIVNTCAVTARSMAKARGIIRRLRAAEPQALVIVTGCGIRINDGALERMAEVDRVFPTLDGAADWLGRLHGIHVPPVMGGHDPDRTRSFIKIQDGCDAFCSYCVVPLVRGKPQSVVPGDVMRAVAASVSRGCKEVVLSGIHLGDYGKDIGGVTLGTVMKEVDKLRGSFRARLSSVEPLEVSDEMLEVMAGSSRFCEHLPLPLQSGSDRVLRAMRRPYGAKKYLEVLERARKVLNNPAITTDIMVGFPGETEADHEETLATIREARFARAHVFIYSPRPGTAAAEMPGRVDARTAKRRSAEVREAAARTAAAFRDGMVGKAEEVLPEARAGRTVEGFSRRYQRVRLAGGPELVGALVNVSITGHVAEREALEARVSGAIQEEA
jgi:threonylcarbamoyladenosine tRNA methylthiotransferase MtaB